MRPLFLAFLVGCGGGSTSADDPGPIVADAAVETSAADAPDAPIANGPWTAPVDLIGVGSAAGEGVLGPIYPMGIWASADQIVVVGLAKASFTWGGATYPHGGFVIAIDASNGALRWHRKIGDSVGAVAGFGDDLAIVGSFFREITLEPASSPIVLRAPGTAAIGSPTDGFVAVITRDGTFRWARRFGSTGYDHGFGVATSGDTIAVSGAISGVADLGEGCPRLEASSGGDDGDGHPSGVKDAVVLTYRMDGSCPFGAVIGAPATNDLAMGVVLRDGALFVTGETGRPTRIRTTSGEDHELAGTSKRTTPFLARIDPRGGKPSTWLSDGGGRGRALAARGPELFWALTTDGESTLAHDGALHRVSPGAHVIVLREDIVRVSDLAETGLDIGSIALTADAAVVAATESEPHGIVLAKLDATSTLTAHHRATAGYPIASAAFGRDVWMAGHSGIDLTVGTPPTKIAVGPQGGFFLVRVRP